ncbi:44828_t:CDS:2, partial [Gigaspora margarita]
IFEEQLNIFTNKNVYKIAFNKDDVFYISYKRLTLVFEPIKQVINFLESRTANLADCFIGISQIAAAFKRIHPSNDLCAPAIASFNFHFEQFYISLYLLTYFLHPNYRTRSLKKGNFKLNFYDKNFEEVKLYSSVVNETIFAKVYNNRSNNDEDEIEIEDLMATDITKVLQDLVNLSNLLFGANNKEEITLIDKEKTNIEFDSKSLVQDVLSDDDLYD